MLICDTHADTLYALGTCQKGGRDHPCDVTPEMLIRNPADTWVQTLALYVSTGGMSEKPTIVEKELAAFGELQKKGCRQVRHISEARAGRANFLLSIEGGEAFGGSLDRVKFFADLGVRMAALMWNNENGIGHPAVSGSEEGLTPFGAELTEALRNAHIAIDISHLNARGSEEVMDSDVPPMASHSCARSLCDHPRNLTDDQIRRLIAARGYMGVNFYGKFLQKNGHATLDTVVDHMVRICELGGEDIVGFGSDFDGIDLYPEGLRTAADIPALLNQMRRRGFDETLVEKIAGLNFMGYLERVDASRP